MAPALLAPTIGVLLELFGLSHSANQDIGSYSKGMKPKVMINAALLHDPTCSFWANRIPAPM